MTPQPLDYRPAQHKAASPWMTQVERNANGAVVVRVNYPGGKFWQGMIRAIGPVALIGFAAIFFAFEGSIQSKVVLPFVPIFILGFVLIPLLMLQVWLRSGSYVFEADREGITLHRNRGRREWIERFAREQITDVVIGFGKGGRHRSTAWLIIALAHRPNRKLLHDLGGDELARVADALRAGIGLPARSWP